MTDDLVTWLRAQIDEDERVALAVSDGPNKPEQWRVEQYKDDPRGYRVAGQHSVVIDGAFGPDAKHIARFDPARVRREVAAKRRILDAYEKALDRRRLFRDDVASAGALLQMVAVVELLVLPYSDRPGRPSTEE